MGLEVWFVWELIEAGQFMHKYGNNNDDDVVYRITGWGYYEVPAINYLTHFSVYRHSIKNLRLHH